MTRQRHLVDAYEPIEDILARPKVRILRALRWFGWVSLHDLADALDVAFVTGESNEEWKSLYDSIRYLVKTGRVEARGSSWDTEYILTDLGRADLARTLRKYEESIGAQRRAA